MEIIKKGELPEEKVLKSTCSRCKTHFSFKVKEANIPAYQDPRDSGTAYAIACPLCGVTCYGYG
jgi:hypothetical protein